MTRPFVRAPRPRSATRRSFLRAVGAGATLLPFYQLLEDSVAQAAGEASPLKLIVISHPHGIANEYFAMRTPDAPDIAVEALSMRGTDTASSFDIAYPNCSLRPFDDAATYGKSFKDRLLLIEGLDLASDGHDAAASILTGSPLTGGKPGNSSLDQYLSVEMGLGASTRKSNVVLGVGEPNPYPGSTLSYSAGGAGMSKIISPYEAFDYLFSGFVAPDDAAGRAAHEQQIREVDARDQQDETDRRPQHDERPMPLAAHVRLERHGHEAVPILAPRLRVLHVEVQVGRDARRIVTGLVERRARAQPADERHDIPPVARMVEVERREEIDTRTRQKDRPEVERRRQHANDRRRLAVEHDVRPDERSVGRELPCPVRMRQQRHRPRTRARIGGGKRASHVRRHAEHLEEVRDDVEPRRGHDVATAIETHVVGPAEGEVTRHALIDAALVTELLVRVRRVGRARQAAGRRRRRNPDELTRVWERQRTKDPGVDDAERGDVRANRERENEDRHQREPPLARERTAGKM